MLRVAEEADPRAVRTSTNTWVLPATVVVRGLDGVQEGLECRRRERGYYRREAGHFVERHLEGARAFEFISECMF